MKLKTTLFACIGFAVWILTGCSSLQTAETSPEGIAFYQYVHGQSGVFHTVSGVTFYEMMGEKPGKFHTVGETTFYDFGKGKSGNFKSVDGTSFYNFDNDTSGTFYTDANGTVQYGFGGEVIQRTERPASSAVQTAPVTAPTRNPNHEKVENGFNGLEEPTSIDEPEIAESTFLEDE